MRDLSEQAVTIVVSAFDSANNSRLWVFAVQQSEGYNPLELTRREASVELGIGMPQLQDH